MNPMAELAKNETAPLSVVRPEVVTQFTAGYVPPFDVASTVVKMIGTVPPKFLNGLSEVVLTNTAGLPRKLRRSVTKSRKRKVKIVETAGLYHQARHGRQAWIEIFVDNALGSLPQGWLRWLWSLSVLREMWLREVLFHELGHHIHTTVRPEHREREDVADVWKLRLERNYFRLQHPTLRRILKLIRFTLGPIYRKFYRRSLEQQLAKGWMSRTEFDESLK